MGNPYPFGVDPVWLTASNSISFLNGYKMKISLIFGVIHMSFGVLLSVWNKVNHRAYHSIILEFFPQIIFIIFINMMLFKAADHDKILVDCKVGDQIFDVYMF